MELFGYIFLGIENEPGVRGRGGCGSGRATESFGIYLLWTWCVYTESTVKSKNAA